MLKVQVCVNCFHESHIIPATRKLTGAFDLGSDHLPRNARVCISPTAHTLKINLPNFARIKLSDGDPAAGSTYPCRWAAATFHYRSAPFNVVSCCRSMIDKRLLLYGSPFRILACVSIFTKGNSRQILSMILRHTAEIDGFETVRNCGKEPIKLIAAFLTLFRVVGNVQMTICSDTYNNSRASEAPWASPGFYPDYRALAPVLDWYRHGISSEHVNWTEASFDQTFEANIESINIPSPHNACITVAWCAIITEWKIKIRTKLCGNNWPHDA